MTEAVSPLDYVRQKMRESLEKNYFYEACTDEFQQWDFVQVKLNELSPVELLDLLEGWKP